jgi:hypothetical protein
VASELEKGGNQKEEEEEDALYKLWPANKSDGRASATLPSAIDWCQTKRQ